MGLLAYRGTAPVGWVSVAPKESFRGLGGPQDDKKIWSLTCLFVARAQRKTCLSAELIQAAAKYARKQGAESSRPIRSIRIPPAIASWASSPPSNGSASRKSARKANGAMSCA